MIDVRDGGLTGHGGDVCGGGDGRGAGNDDVDGGAVAGLMKPRLQKHRSLMWCPAAGEVVGMRWSLWWWGWSWVLLVAEGEVIVEKGIALKEWVFEGVGDGWVGWLGSGAVDPTAGAVVGSLDWWER